jgi:hypothetical protein
MRFSATEVSFGRHETFHLRFSWLPKGFRVLMDDPSIFDDIDQATLVLGVGKNMVQAIRFWMRATKMMTAQGYESTPFGKAIFHSHHGYDPYMEDEGTLWLLHWLLASNTQSATSVAWFFNKYHKNSFDQAELRAAFSTYLQKHVKDNRRPANSTLKNDISVLVRLYAKSQGTVIGEEALDSPFAELDLMFQDGKTNYNASFDERPSLPSRILGIAVLQLMAARSIKIIPLEELMLSSDDFVSVGSVFRLSEASFIMKIEELVRNYAENFSFRDTAGLRQLFLDQPIAPQRLLEDHYLKSQKGMGYAA